MTALGAVTTALVVLVALAGPASAHHATVTGDAACVSGTWKITWGVTNSEDDKVMTVTASNNAAVPVGTTVGKSDTDHFVQVVAGPGDYSLAIATSWPNGVTNDPGAKVVHVAGDCSPPDACDGLPGTQPPGTPCSHEPEVTTVPKHEESCALGGENDWTRTTTVSYVFNPGSNSWVAQDPVVTETAKVFTAWTEAEKIAHHCALPPVDVCDGLPGNQPTGTPCLHEPEVTTVPKHEESCALGGENDWTRTTTVSYVFNPGSNSWVAQDPVVTETAKVFTAWTEAEKIAHHCALPPVDVCDDLPGNQPVGTPCTRDPDVATATQHEESCVLGGQNTWTETTTVTYLFDVGANAWVAQAPVVMQGEKVFTAWTDQERADHGCAVVLPPLTPVPPAPPAPPSAVPPLPNTGVGTDLAVLSVLGGLCLLAGAGTLRLSTSHDGSGSVAAGRLGRFRAPAPRAARLLNRRRGTPTGLESPPGL